MNISFYIFQCIQVLFELIVQILFGFIGLDVEELGLFFFGILDRYFFFYVFVKNYIVYNKIFVCINYSCRE